jgi:hypothetical protein
MANTIITPPWIAYELFYQAIQAGLLIQGLEVSWADGECFKVWATKECPAHLPRVQLPDHLRLMVYADEAERALAAYVEKIQ